MVMTASEIVSNVSEKGDISDIGDIGETGRLKGAGALCESAEESIERDCEKFGDFYVAPRKAEAEEAPNCTDFKEQVDEVVE